MVEKEFQDKKLIGQYDSIDLGCGSNKITDTWGVDHFAFPGEDQIVDLDSPPWPMATRMWPTSSSKFINIADC